jgi:hypothetical protein
MTVIHVSAFQPFESRRGIDTVLALRFRFDRDLVELLKEALRQARCDLDLEYQAGGWLPQERAWFCEREAWPSVRAQLRLAGYDVTGPEAEADDEADDEPHQSRQQSSSRQGPASASSRDLVDVKGVLKRWRNEMALRYHPDRGGDVRAMQAINNGYDRLLEMLGV